MSAAHPLALLDADLPAPAALVDEDAPRISAEDLDAFEAWRRTHPPAPLMGRTDHAEWMVFLAVHQLAALRAPASANGGAPPATSTTIPDVDAARPETA